MGKAKDPSSIHYVRYKQARGSFQYRYRQEAELCSIKENNTIMQADFNNKGGFFNIIKNMRSNKLSQSPSTLHTPTGTYFGKDTLEGFTADAELLG